MADKAEKKESHSEGGGGWQAFSDVFFWLLLALVALSLIGSAFSGFAPGFSLPDATSITAFIFNQLQVFSIFLSLVFFIGIIYCNFLTSSLGAHHHGADHAHIESVNHPQAPRHPDERWQSIMQRISSPNEGDWRVAIIEADIILDDMLTRMGYFGEGVAEKLKQIEKPDFKTIDSAWEAHKVRNSIAHAGSSYKLSRGLADKTIRQFKEVFEEFYFI